MGELQQQAAQHAEVARVEHVQLQGRVEKLRDRETAEAELAKWREAYESCSAAANNMSDALSTLLGRPVAPETFEEQANAALDETNARIEAIVAGKQSGVGPVAMGGADGPVLPDYASSNLLV